MQKMLDVLKRLKKGETFNKLAKELSQDLGSAKQGGDLGFFGRGVMDKDFEKSAFNLQKDEVSKPVRSAFGYHLIKLEKINAEKVKTFSDVRDGIKKELQIQQAEQTFYELSEKLSNITYEHPGSLQPVVDELGLILQKTELFDRNGGKGLTAKQKIITAAFSDEVLSLGRNSDLIELSDSRLIVLRKLEHQQPSQKPLADVHKQIQGRLAEQVTREKVSEQLQKALQALQKGQSPKKLTKTIQGAKWIRAGLIYRTKKDGKSNNTTKLDPQIRRKAFALAKPQDDKPSWGKSGLANGDGVVIGLFKVNLSDKPQHNPQEQQRLAQSNGSALFGRLLEQQRLKADIQINLPKEDE